VLLRSWIGERGLAGQAAWVTAGRNERDPQRFSLSVVHALRATGPGSELVRAVSAAPDLDGWALVEQLLADLAPLEEQLWLVVDDAHELDPDQALRQLELLLMRAPSALRFVLATRHDLRLGLHRLRLEGELDEIRAGDCGSAWRRRGSCSRLPEWSYPGRRWRCCMSGPRAGRRGCG
jgi:LuxR family transcriptional regulator, maltose regulon positive regulatory protein